MIEPTDVTLTVRESDSIEASKEQLFGDDEDLTDLAPKPEVIGAQSGEDPSTSTQESKEIEDILEVGTSEARDKSGSKKRAAKKKSKKNVAVQVSLDTWQNGIRF
ncbi:unnamed protein product [Cladocopium goreaui]|uniref:Uncharacterized protein n=1 Tax=Cladocopium goreaui TaxID=2562237 RepID=A0A9P1DG07_9DINO|nr:unnamed protein product [Cladocopium goreaui]